MLVGGLGLAGEVRGDEVIVQDLDAEQIIDHHVQLHPFDDGGGGVAVALPNGCLVKGAPQVAIAGYLRDYALEQQYGALRQ